CVCVCVCVCVRFTSWAFTLSLPIYIWPCMLHILYIPCASHSTLPVLNTHTHTHTHIHTHTHTHTHTGIELCRHTNTQTCIHTHTCLLRSVHIVGYWPLLRPHLKKCPQH